MLKLAILTWTVSYGRRRR